MTTLREGVVRDAVPQQARGPAFRPDIEGLRAVAVLLVVLSHVGVAWLPGGFVGVDVFFTISGFLITSLLLRELADTGRVSLGRFYARRAVRLLPASSLVLVLTLLACWSWLSPVRIASYAGDALASALYVSNLRFAVTGTDYFAEDSVPSPFQHFWSLAVEEQFYLCWPLMIILVAWCVRGRLRAVLGGVLLVVVVGSLALSIVETGRSATVRRTSAYTPAPGSSASEHCSRSAPAGCAGSAQYRLPHSAGAGWPPSPWRRWRTTAPPPFRGSRRACRWPVPRP